MRSIRLYLPLDLELQTCEYFTDSSLLASVMILTSHALKVEVLLRIWRYSWTELELELIQTQMVQKPMLRAEVCARALSSLV